jgi:tetratricopeptide (TPR) repeat protein
LLVAGNAGDAIAEYGELLRVDPNDVESHNNLGFARIQTGELAGAIASLQRALELKPTYSDAHYNLARALSLAGRPAAALHEFRETLQLRRDWVPALTELAWLQATTADAEARNADDALGFALRAVELSGRRDAAALNALAAAYAAGGRFDAASKTAEEAENVAAVSAPLLVAQIRAHLNLYRAGRAIVIPGS